MALDLSNLGPESTYESYVRFKCAYQEKDFNQINKLIEKRCGDAGLTAFANWLFHSIEPDAAPDWELLDRVIDRIKLDLPEIDKKIRGLLWLKRNYMLQSQNFTKNACTHASKTNLIEFSNWLAHSNVISPKDPKWKARVIHEIVGLNRMSTRCLREIDALFQHFQADTNLVLHKVISTGKSKWLNLLLQTDPISVEKALFTYDEQGLTPFHIAIEKGEIGMIKTLLRSMPHLAQRMLVKQDAHGYTPLHLAIHKGRPAVVKAIFQTAPHLIESMLTTSNDKGNSPLHLGLYRAGEGSGVRSRQIANMLIKAIPAEAKTAVYSAKNNKGETPIHIVIKLKDNLRARLIAKTAPEVANAILTFTEPENSRLLTQVDKDLLPEFRNLKCYGEMKHLRQLFDELRQATLERNTPKIQIAIAKLEANGQTHLLYEALIIAQRSFNSLLNKCTPEMLAAYLRVVTPAQIKQIMINEEAIKDVGLVIALLELKDTYPSIVKEIIQEAITKFPVVHLAVTYRTAATVSALQHIAPDEFAQALTKRDLTGNSPLHKAILDDKFEIIRLLLSLNSSTEVFSIPNNDGYTPFSLAIQTRPELVPLFWDAMPEDVKAAQIKNQNKNSALFSAIKTQNLELLQLFTALENQEAAAFVRDSMLSLAIQIGRPEFSQKLLLQLSKKEQIRQITLQNNQKKTVLHLAIETNNWPLVAQLLIIPGIAATFSMQDENGNTPLGLLFQERPKFARTLWEQLPPHERIRHMNLQNKQQETLLHWAIKNDSPDLFKILLELPEAAAATTVRDANGNTPIQLLSKKLILKSAFHESDITSFYQLMDFSKINKNDPVAFIASEMYAQPSILMNAFRRNPQSYFLLEFIMGKEVCELLRQNETIELLIMEKLSRESLEPAELESILRLPLLLGFPGLAADICHDPKYGQDAQNFYIQNNLFVSTKIIDSLYQFDSGHLKKGEQKPIPEAPEDVNIEDLERMFMTIDFTTISPNRLKDGNKILTQSELHEKINNFINKIKNRTPFTGTPKADSEELIAFYLRLENYVKHVTHALQVIDAKVAASAEDREKKNLLAERNGILIDLAIAGQYCGTRFFMDSTTAYQHLCGGENSVEELSLEGRLHAEARHKRLQIVQQAAGANVHSYNHYMDLLGETLGLTEAAASYKDPLAPRNISFKEALKKFNKAYTPSIFLREIMAAVNGEGNIPPRISQELTQTWLSEHLPSDWVPFANSLLT